MINHHIRKSSVKGELNDEAARGGAALLIPACGRQRRMDLCEFEASVVYKTTPGQPWPLHRKTLWGWGEENQGKKWEIKQTNDENLREWVG